MIVILFVFMFAWWYFVFFVVKQPVPRIILGLVGLAIPGGALALIIGAVFWAVWKTFTSPKTS